MCDDSKSKLIITDSKFWDSVATKLVSTLISVKFWIILLASFFSYKMLGVYLVINGVVLDLAVTATNQNVEVINTLSQAMSKLLDITFAMFTSVIVVITLSREVFKHAKINYKEKTDIKSNINI